MGAVGIPVWLWTDPWTPQTATATIRGYTITATAIPTQVDWTLGDGTNLTCTNAGTIYSKAYGFTESPDCGHVYERTSAAQPEQAFPITATMNWDVSWEGAATGTTTTDTTENVPVRIGEYQTVITG